MCNKDYLRLVVGESVILKGVPVSWPRKGWLGWVLRHFWRRWALIDLTLLSDYGILFIEATRSDGRSFGIPHYTIFADECPSKFDTKEKNLWKALRYILRREISFYQAQYAAKKETSRWGSSMAKRIVWPKQPEMVVLSVDSALPTKPMPFLIKPESDLVDSALATLPGETSTRPELTPDKKTVAALERILDPKCIILMPEHLFTFNVSVDQPFKLPTPQGPLGFTRNRLLGEDTLKLVLEYVPSEHSLYKLWAEEVGYGRKVSIWLGRNGPMPTIIGTPAGYLAAFLVTEAWPKELLYRKVA